MTVSSARNDPKVSVGDGAARWILWIAAIAILGMATHQGSTAFIIGLPILYYLIWRVIGGLADSRAIRIAAMVVAIGAGLSVLLIPRNQPQKSTSPVRISRESSTGAVSPEMANLAYTEYQQALKENDTSAAREHLAKAVEYGYTGDQSLLLLAALHEQLGDRVAADAVMDRLARQNSREPIVHYELGAHYLRRGDKQRAEASLNKAAEMFPPDSSWGKRTERLLKQVHQAH